MGCLDVLSSVAGCYTLPFSKAGQLVTHAVFTATFKYILGLPQHFSGLNQLAPESRGDFFLPYYYYYYISHIKHLLQVISTILQMNA